ncbi:MAG: GNAT family N-acetyltransferase [Burkholderiales bacterium]|jgi:GNAT superfamily N-acetyltransferase|nr:GNAT family N-acetyltransferase [Burkholderiales bacterium]
MTTPDRTLRHAETEAELLACIPVMRELRPQLDSTESFIERVRMQHGQGWRLLAEWQGGTPCALASYRWLDNLIHGRFIYIDDLVTTEASRGGRSGERLLAELERFARAGGASKLVLDTGLANSRAQRFYFRCGLLATGLHFTKVLA